MRPLGLRVPVPSNDLYFVCDAWLCFLNAFQAAFVAVCVHNYITVIACIWILLCLGGAMLPPLTGILMASVDAELRTFASGFSMFMYNVLGYALGTPPSSFYYLRGTELIKLAAKQQPGETQGVNELHTYA
eukprot:GHVT01088657.1.p2 GENE.GHVT01088657.1~~GHVT01088657.1.p2  ORF type:complete len:131 (-),score=11.38 GHVT01088657.1:1595-1987(-)